MTRQNAERAVTTIAKNTLLAFTDRQPNIAVRCDQPRRNYTKCRVRVTSDRLDATWAATVRLTETQYVVRFGSMRLR
jgi:hypothetical protein